MFFSNSGLGEEGCCVCVFDHQRVSQCLTTSEARSAKRHHLNTVGLRSINLIQRLKRFHQERCRVLVFSIICLSPSSAPGSFLAPPRKPGDGSDSVLHPSFLNDDESLARRHLTADHGQTRTSTTHRRPGTRGPW